MRGPVRVLDPDGRLRLVDVGREFGSAACTLGEVERATKVKDGVVTEATR
jgi:hypothetical protein